MPATRRQAVEHNLECIEIGRTLGSKALTVWIGDGSNFPGQVNFARAFERYLDSMREIYAGLPDDWRLFTEHKMYEPAFYSTVVQDWGTNYIIAQELGPKAYCLVDLGHHAPNVNIEMIVSRLIQFKKLGGFHFNDSKYGDDDLDAGSIDPYRLFLVFNELVDAELNARRGLRSGAHARPEPQCHRPDREPDAVGGGGAARLWRGLLVDREALAGYQDGNDALMATQTLKSAFRTDVDPILAHGAAAERRRHRSGRRLSRQRVPQEGRGGAAGRCLRRRRHSLAVDVERERHALEGVSAAADRLHGFDHAAPPVEHGVGERNQAGIRRRARRRQAERLCEFSFVARGLERSGYDIGRGGRAADAGVTVDHQRPCAVPALGEIEQRAHMGLAGQGHALLRLCDVVQRQPEMVLLGDH